MLTYSNIMTIFRIRECAILDTGIFLIYQYVYGIVACAFSEDITVVLILNVFLMC